MQSRPPECLIDRAAAALLRQARGWAATLGCVALVLAGGIPDPAWSQYRSGGYSRPSGGSGSFLPPGGRRSAAAAATAGRLPRLRCSAAALPGDRAMSRGRSSEALRDYRASQRPPPTSAPRPYAPPPRAADRGWASGGGWGAACRGGRRPGAAAGAGQPAALLRHRHRDRDRAVDGAQRADVVAEPGRDLPRAPQRPRISRVAARGRTAAARDPEVAGKLDELDQRLAQLERQPGSAGGGPAAHARAGRRVLAVGHRRSSSEVSSCCSGCGGVAPPVRASLGQHRRHPGSRRLGRSRASGSAWCCRSTRPRFYSPPG